jgi:hypothetical protein
VALKRKTWLWILVAVVGFCLLCVIALAGFGLYFVANHIETRAATSSEAFKAFDDARDHFKDERPILELDSLDRPRLIRPLKDLPTSPISVSTMWVLAWDPDKERLVRVSVPFWLLRFGWNVDLSGGVFDIDKLDLDVRDLQRVGPVLLFDYRKPEGERVLVWTR